MHSRLIKLSLVFALAASLCACSENNLLKPHKTQLPLAPNSLRNEADIGPFNSVAIHGPFNVNVLFIPQQYFISYQGNGGLVSQVNYYISDDVLHVFTNQEFAYSPGYLIDLTIEVPTLTRLSYRGPGKIEANNIDEDYLTLNLEEGAYAFLSGKVTRFDASLTGNSRLNAKCLYTRTAFVNTTDMAQAEVATNGSVSALSAEKSDIYYYEHPDLVAKFENTYGSVLRMEGIADARPEYTGPVVPMMKPGTAIMAPIG